MFLKNNLKVNNRPTKREMINKNTDKGQINRGFSLVEILVGSSIICVSLLLIINLEAGISRIGFSSMGRVQAGMLAEEGVVAVLNIRNDSWQNINVLNNDTPYRLYWNGVLGKWTATTSSALIDGSFDRTVTFYEVRRDANTFDILSSGSGGDIDSGTKKIVVNVTWNSGFGTSTKSMTSYVYNVFNQ